MRRDLANLSSAWAPAKVNLYLEVGPPRSNGRHPLDSLVMFADTRAADRISARPAADISISLDGPGAGALRNEPNNMVLKAAYALREAAGLSGVGASLGLHKTLPTAAGIAGGSADAAATLRVLNQLWQLGFADAALEALAADLGSDTPACFRAQPAVMRGTGEMLSAAAAPDLPIVLANPGVAVSTEAVYKRFDKLRGGASFKEAPSPEYSSERSIAEFVKALQARRNDLEPAATSLCSPIKQVLATLESQDGVLLSRMSGSGATCFGIFETEDAAQNAVSAIAKKKSKWWVCASKLRGRVAAQPVRL